MTHPIDSSSLFVVTGGGRGITAQCVIGMARQFGCRFLILGRSSLDAADPPWAEGCDGETELRRRAAASADTDARRMTPAEIGRAVSGVLAGREIRSTLDAVARAGGTATYAPVDVANVVALRRTIAEFVPAGDHVSGVIHGAGVLADKPIERKSLNDFDRVYDPKVRGLINLLTCIPPHTLQYLVLFSSAAAYYGNPGQADYALANEILNKAAYRLRAAYPECRVIAIDWGPWQGGMVTPELQRLFTARGVQVIEIEQGVRTLLSLLAASSAPPQVVVGDGRLAPISPPPAFASTPCRVHRRLSLDDNPFLHHHVIAGHAVLPAVCAFTWIGHACEDLVPGYSVASLDDMTVLKGIVFDASTAFDCVMDLTETARVDGQIVYAVRIWSPNGGTQGGAAMPVRFHYSGSVTLRQRVVDAPLEAVPDLSVGEGSIDGSSLYRDAVLFHGPSFQGVRRVLRAGEDGLTMECCLPPVSPVDQGQFPARSLNPFITDVQLQSQVIWARLMRGAVSLPMRGTRYEFFRSIEFGEPFFVVLRIRSADAFRTVADITSYDTAGRVCMRFLGSETTSHPRLNEMLQAGVAR